MGSPIFAKFYNGNCQIKYPWTSRPPQFSIFKEYGEQSAKTRRTRERSTFDEHHRYEDDNYAKATTASLKKNFRALARGFGILLRALTHGRAELKPSLHRKGKKPASEKSPAGLSALQSPRPASLGERSLAASTRYMSNMVGKILSRSDEDGCAVRFTGSPGRTDRITVDTMTHLLSSKGFHFRRNTETQKHAAVLRRAKQNPRTSFFFSLPTSSVSRIVAAPVPKAKLGIFPASDLHQGDIVAAPWECTDEPGAVQYFLGEVRNVKESYR